MDKQQPVTRPSKHQREQTDEEVEAIKRSKCLSLHDRSDCQHTSTNDSSEETKQSRESDYQPNTNIEEPMDIETLLQTIFSIPEDKTGISETSPHHSDQCAQTESIEQQRSETSTIPQLNNIQGLQLDRLRQALELIDQNPELFSQTTVDSVLTGSQISKLTFLNQVFHDAQVVTATLLQPYNDLRQSLTTNHETTLDEPRSLAPYVDCEETRTNHDDHSNDDAYQRFPSSISSIFQEPAENLPPASISTELNLSKTLQYSYAEMKENILMKLKIERQPSGFWKPRTLSCLENGKCSIVQADKNIEATKNSKHAKKHPVAVFSKVALADISSSVLLATQLLDPNDQPHGYKMILSPKAKIRESVSNEANTKSTQYTWRDVEMGERYGYDRENCVLLRKLTEDEKTNGKVDIQFKMVNEYKKRKSCRKTSFTSQSSSSSSAETDYINKKFCKFRLCLCQLDSLNELVRISNYATSIIIEDGIRQLKIENVSPTVLNPDGTNEIMIQFNAPINKADLDIFFNNKKLKPNSFRIRSSGIIIFRSVKKSEETEDDARVKVVKKHFLETNKQNEIIEQRFIDKVLVDYRIRYD